MITRDKVLDGANLLALMAGQDHPGGKLPVVAKTRDGKTVDTSGAFLVGELERLDQTLHQPLSSISWDRDVPLRDDVTLGDEVTSFTQSTFGTPSGPGNTIAIGQKRSFIGKKSTEIAEMDIDIGKVTLPLIPWGEGVSYSLAELASAAQTGRPIDSQKIDALNREHQLQTDAQAYLGWTGNSTFGLINSNQVTPTNFPNGAANGSQWMPHTGYVGKTPSEILTDLANLAFTPWAASGFALRPNRILLDPQNFNFISVTPATAAGSKSILRYFLESYNADTGAEPLRILPVKWLTGAGVGGNLLQPGTTNRAVSYHRYEGDWKQAPVRFPMTMLQRTPVQYDGLFHKLYYWGRLGACEFVYPETVAYMDGN
jgi:hypothetical protein